MSRQMLRYQRAGAAGVGAGFVIVLVFAVWASQITDTALAGKFQDKLTMVEISVLQN